MKAASGRQSFFFPDLVQYVEARFDSTEICIMPILTLKLPDDLYERLRTAPEKERPNFAVAWMRRGADAETELGEDYASEVDLKDACAKIAAGLADFDAGRFLSLEVAREQSLALFDRRVVAPSWRA